MSLSSIARRLGIKHDDTGLSFKKSSEAELDAMIWRGRMALELRAQEFWVEHVCPGVKEEVERIQSRLEWTPGATDNTVEKIALDRVWLSALLKGSAILTTVLNRMIMESNEALKEKSRREKEK